MNQASYQAITKMLNAFPQTTGNVKALLLTYDEALTGIPDVAIYETASRFTGGSIEGQSMTFVPSIAEFKQAASKQADLISARQRPRLPAPEFRRTGPTPFEIRQAQARQKYADWAVHQTDVGYDQFWSLKKAGKLPDNATWSATLGIIFVPRKVA